MQPPTPSDPPDDPEPDGLGTPIPVVQPQTDQPTPLSAHLKKAGRALFDLTKDMTLTAANFMREQVTEIRKSQAKSHASYSGDSANLNKLGDLLDGWSDLIENRGEKATAIRRAIYQDLRQRQMPEVQLAQVDGIIRANLTLEHRPHILALTYPGATTTLYVSPHGSDLYVAWRTFIRRILNKRTIVVMMLVAVALSLFTGVGASFESLVSEDNQWGILGTLATLCCGIILPLVLIFIGEWAVLIGLGFWLFRDPFALLYVQPSLFDADDITAMSLTVHYAIKKALEQADIDTALLRTKTEFTAGRRGEKF